MCIVGIFASGWNSFSDGERRRWRSVRTYGIIVVGEKANFFGTGVRARMRLWPVLFGRTYAFVRVENSYVLRGGSS